MNPTLDRGPAAFEFDTGRQQESSGEPASAKRVIDLTPNLEDSSDLNDPQSSIPTSPARSRPVPAPPLPGPIGSERSSPTIQREDLQVDQILPEPMQDSGSLEMLPPTIEKSLSP
jgi:hypothetical protein